MTDRTLDRDLFAVLAKTIATTLSETPVRLGHPEGAADLAATLTVKVAAYFGSILPTAPGVAGFMAEIDAERGRQLAKFGDQRHPDGTDLTEDRDRADRARHVCESMARMGQLTWRDVLHEEVQEAFAESDHARLRAELIQVAAVCAAWVSDLDRRTADCPSCEVDIEHTVHCPTPGTHNWGCGCPTDEMPAAARREDPS